MEREFNLSEKGPHHVAIIMDGNGRWAQRRGRRRLTGHRLGATAVRNITEAAVELGLKQLTLYAFSTENWCRPPEEVSFLMRLFRRFLRSERRRLIANNVRLRAIGRLGELPPLVREELMRTMDLTRHCTGTTLCLAVNYGARSELVDAVRNILRFARERQIGPAEIGEATIEACLYQPDMPPLDLLIRTGGEMRLSNFLLWQAAYAELWMTPVCWPEFGREHLCEAIRVFQGRARKFGTLSPKKPELATGVKAG